VQVIYYIDFVFPIKDHNPSYKTPVVTYTLILMCSIAWLYELSLWTGLDAFFEVWALQPWEIMDWESLVTLFSSMFLHGGWMHIIWNMLFLYIFWDNLEARMGHVKFLLFYIVSGLVASALQIYSDPTSLIPNIGASWAIAWVMWGYLLLYPHAKVDTIIMFPFFKKITLPAFFILF
jgi:membrane associated rhomboid family serine protease